MKYHSKRTSKNVLPRIAITVPIPVGEAWGIERHIAKGLAAHRVRLEAGLPARYQAAVQRGGRAHGGRTLMLAKVEANS